jgi:hypothetical protein
MNNLVDALAAQNSCLIILKGLLSKQEFELVVLFVENGHPVAEFFASHSIRPVPVLSPRQIFSFRN